MIRGVNSFRPIPIRSFVVVICWVVLGGFHRHGGRYSGYWRDWSDPRALSARRQPSAIEPAPILVRIPWPYEPDRWWNDAARGRVSFRIPSGERHCKCLPPVSWRIAVLFGMNPVGGIDFGTEIELL